MSAGHEPFAVEHRGHDAPSEQVDREIESSIGRGAQPSVVWVFSLK